MTRAELIDALKDVATEFQHINVLVYTMNNEALEIEDVELEFMPDGTPIVFIQTS